MSLSKPLLANLLALSYPIVLICTCIFRMVILSVVLQMCTTMATTSICQGGHVEEWQIWLEVYTISELRTIHNQFVKDKENIVVTSLLLNKICYEIFDLRFSRTCCQKKMQSKVCGPSLHISNSIGNVKLDKVSSNQQFQITKIVVTNFRIEVELQKLQEVKVDIIIFFK